MVRDSKEIALRNAYQGRKCLVTGHTGFKGSWLSLWMHRIGARVTGYALDPPTDPSLFAAADVAGLVEDCRGDIRDFEFLRQTVQRTRPAIVFHLAAQALVRPSYTDPKYTFDTNVGGTINLLDACRLCPMVDVIVVVTSDKCYENLEQGYAYRENDPLGGCDPYSASKAAVEIVCSGYRRAFFDASGVSLVTTRAGNTIGGGDWASDRIVPDTVRALNAKVPVRVMNPDSIRPWQHVLDPLFGYLLVGARMLEGSCSRTEVPLSGGAWNFGPDTHSCRPVQELVERFLAAYGEGSWVEASAYQKDLLREARSLFPAYDRAYHWLGWQPRWGFEEAVAKTAHW